MRILLITSHVLHEGSVERLGFQAIVGVRDLDSILSHKYLSLSYILSLFASLFYFSNRTWLKPQCQLNTVICLFHICKTILLILHYIYEHNFVWALNAA
jgi:hypothetical protein